MKILIVILIQISSGILFAQLTAMSIRNKCRGEGDEDSCRYVQLAQEKTEAQQKCGTFFKNQKACEKVVELEAELGKVLSNLKTADSGSDEKIHTAKPDKKFRQPSSEDDGDCDNCG